MKRAEVPLEQFEIQFNPDRLEDATKSKEALVTILRFLDRSIFPEVKKIADSVPQISEMENYSLRTTEDGSYVLRVESYIRYSLNGLIFRVERYLDKALQGLSVEDGEYVRLLVMHKLCEAMKQLKDIAQTADAKFDNFAEASLVRAPQGHTSFPEGDRVGVIIEKSMDEAVESPRTSIDRLFRGN